VAARVRASAVVGTALDRVAAPGERPARVPSRHGLLPRGRLAAVVYLTLAPLEGAVEEATLFGWVDFAEEDRRRMKELVALVRDTETRDELGLAVIRDAFANLLFPGTSVIQTRARYALFVPWMYQRLERRRPVADPDGRGRAEEGKLVKALLETAEREGHDIEGAGIIGRVLGDRVQRRPSSVYWAGLQQWGIRRFDGSIEAYHRELASPRDMTTSRGDDGNEKSAPDEVPWDGELPPPPADWPEGAWMTLNRQEAEYLRDRIDAITPQPLLSHLLQLSRTKDLGTDFAWQHPSFGRLPATIQAQLQHARRFSEVMHGASLLYNLMLSRAIENDDWIGDYEARLEEWSAVMGAEAPNVSNWDLALFWKLLETAGAVLSPEHPTRKFVARWIDLVRDRRNASKLADHRSALDLVRTRERNVKHKRARLASKEMLHRWSGASGAYQLDYRWSRVRVIVRDIVQGLGR
jgi:hypothetical protein